MFLFSLRRNEGERKGGGEEEKGEGNSYRGLLEPVWVRGTAFHGSAEVC